MPRGAVIRGRGELFRVADMGSGWLTQGVGFLVHNTGEVKDYIEEVLLW